jgi:hypothetical protein
VYGQFTCSKVANGISVGCSQSCLWHWDINNLRHYNGSPNSPGNKAAFDHRGSLIKQNKAALHCSSGPRKAVCGNGNTGANREGF